ncbi:MAG: DUF4440 domain-containing protein [Ignavibacteriaceae bacterium]
MKYFVFLSILILHIGCSQDVDTGSEKAKLIQTDKDFSHTSLKLGAAEAFNKFLTEDALELPAGKNPVEGRKNIYDMMKGNQGDYTLEWTPQYAEVAKSGELGYSWGTYVLSYKNEKGEEQKSYGKYLNIWKKQTDGNWRVAVDMGNNSPEPEN